MNNKIEELIDETGNVILEELDDGGKIKAHPSVVENWIKNNVVNKYTNQWKEKGLLENNE